MTRGGLGPTIGPVGSTKCLKGQNQSPNDEYLKGVAPADVSSDPELIRYLKRKMRDFLTITRKEYRHGVELFEP